MIVKYLASLSVARTPKFSKLCELEKSTFWLSMSSSSENVTLDPESEK